MRPDQRINWSIASARYRSRFCNKMKTVGIIGGIGPESTIEYYRFIIAGYRERKGDGSYPSIIINSVDLNQLIAWMNANELDNAAEYLVREIERLARAGADFGALASN